MPDNNFIDAHAFTFEPFPHPLHPDEEGDSGALELATSKALYVILNEGDSREYYLDEHGKLFKLDNADSFTVQQTTIMLFDGNPIGKLFIPDINAPMNAVGYDWHDIMYRNFSGQYDQMATNAYLRNDTQILWI